MIEQLRAAMEVEAQKLVASRVVQSATVLLIVGAAALTGSMAAAANAGNEQVLAQLGPLADVEGWSRVVGVALQITAAAGLLTFGVVLAWIVGREFGDGTVNGLFALPVSRPAIILAKLVVFVAWTFVVAIGLVIVVWGVGLAVSDVPPDPEESRGSLLARLDVLTVLSGAVAVPAAWVSTLGRGVLPGIASTVVTIVVAQVMVVSGTGAWFPVAAPALWAFSPSAVSVLQLGFVALVPVTFGLLATRAWSRLQLDR